MLKKQSSDSAAGWCHVWDLWDSFCQIMFLNNDDGNNNDDDNNPLTTLCIKYPVVWVHTYVCVVIVHFRRVYHQAKNRPFWDTNSREDMIECSHWRMFFYSQRMLLTVTSRENCNLCSNQFVLNYHLYSSHAFSGKQTNKQNNEPSFKCYSGASWEL